MPTIHINVRKLATFLQLGLVSVIIYYGMKLVIDSLDSTRKRPGQLTQKEADQLLQKIGLKGIRLTDHELSLASTVIDPLTIPVSWKDIGGLDSLIKDLKETVILPMRQRSLFKKSHLLSAPKGVLLYGPPGCGKTMVAKATARNAGCRFINVQVSTLHDKWYGESQKLAAALFSLARKLAPCIVFIDEIDSFLRSRSLHDHEVTAMVKAQFMNMWDGLQTEEDCQVMIMGATNRPEDVDTAILRRMVAAFHVGLPDGKQRESILKIILANERVEEDFDYGHIASLTEGCSGSDIKELCRSAAIGCVREYLSGFECDEDYANLEKLDEVTIRNINTKDMEAAIEKCKPLFVHHKSRTEAQK
ncbi:ATPase family AAA domain-containing protein 1-like [Dendronephthya gigantea]|uniref:ATPase family AAA domain-containing protein 1-like n=1 Tax=Dendronephthya gigantea TaxID=151771 RepID=UPI00106C1337|nr:ATPase family AAA domain-containing protein 1-like [Dendronephthya gigantea]